MRAVAPLPLVEQVKKVYAGPVLVYSGNKTFAVAKEKDDRSRNKYSEDGDIFKGMLVAQIMEVAGGVCLYFIWHVGHLLR